MSGTVQLATTSYRAGLGWASTWTGLASWLENRRQSIRICRRLYLALSTKH